MDKANLHELIKFIQESIALIKRRFESIKTSDDFLANDEGIDRLDAISMRLQGIGEAIKNIDKRERDLLLKVADGLYWSKIIKTREILTHHYIDIDAQIIYEICHDKLVELEEKIQVLQNILE
ncbi:MAG: HepT-like ribonuclease domain-containing protein [Sulfuricurvum sp.]|jgi:uncharacterized protein with HEPN domain